MKKVDIHVMLEFTIKTDSRPRIFFSNQSFNIFFKSFFKQRYSFFSYDKFRRLIVQY